MRRLLRSLTTRYTEVTPIDGGRSWAVETGFLHERVWRDALRFGAAVALYNLWMRLR